MSEDDKRELSGLARSIDRLFADEPRAGRPREERDSAEEPGDVGRTADAEDRADEGADVPRAPSGPAPWAGPALIDEPAVPDETTPEAIPFERMTQTPTSPGLTPPPLPEALSDARQGEPWPDPADEAAPAVVAHAQRDFARAVEDFLAGEPGSRARVEELTDSLRDRVALDLLADAVERLVREAGDPPDPALLDVATGIMNPAVASRIVQRIGQERDEVRKAEYVLLCRCVGVIMATAFRGALTDATDAHARRMYHDMLIAMGEVSRPIIEAMIDDENRFLVRNAVAILGETGGDRAVELVTSALAHPDGRVRREALLSLAKLGHTESGALVVGFFEDSEPEVRVAAAVAAGELKVERALRPLLAMVADGGDADLLVPVIRALGQLGDPGAVPALEKHAVRSLFSRPPLEVRVAAYRALHRIGTPHARELVREALQDKEAAVQAAARELVRSDNRK